MKKTTVFTVIFTMAVFAAGFGLVSVAGANPNWTLDGDFVIEFTCTSGCSGVYPHTMTVDDFDAATGDFSGTGHYNPDNSISWDVTGNVDGSDVIFHIVYNNVNAGYMIDAEGVIAGDGSMSGTAESSTGQEFDWETTSGTAEALLNEGEILEPAEGEIVYGMTDLVATYNDWDDVNDDIVQWAVREGTCAAGTNTVFGNVDGFSDSYNWDGADFDAVIDTSTLDPGKYCFVFNPKDDAGRNDVRETREFWVADGAVFGGGHALEVLEEGDKRKDWHDVSFGGGIYEIGDDEYVGDWQVNLHNVGADLDGSKFHGSAEDLTAINFFDGNSNTCDAALNFEMTGEFNHEPGYTMIFRAGDNGSPNDVDTVRVTIKHGGDTVYDTHAAGEFSDESSCVGTARTGLDTGNITIVRP